MTLNISQKGLVLIALPLCFQLAFVLLVVHFQSENATAERLASHTKEVIAQGHEVSSLVTDAQSSVRGFVLTENPAYDSHFRKASEGVRTQTAEVSSLVADNPAQQSAAGRVRVAAIAVIQWQEGVAELVQTKTTAGAITQIRTGRGEELMAAFRRESAAFIGEEERLDRDRLAALDQSRARMNVLLVVGGVVAVLTTLALGFAFRAGIVRRFATVEETARRLMSGSIPPSPLPGGDEAARLDTAFRETAAALSTAAARVRDLYDHAPCGYHSVDPNGIFVEVNQTELRWLGYTAEEVVGKMGFADLVEPNCRDRYRAAFDVVKQVGGVSDIELEVRRKDGTTFPVLVNSSAVRDAEGRYIRSRTTMVDITERKRAEDQVRQLNAELEGRVQSRTEELAVVNRDLAHRNAENEMFVYSVSHDLRSPLVNLQGFSKELEKACRGLGELLAADGVPTEVRSRGEALLGGKVAKSIGFIQSAVLRLSNIIDALLRLSRAGRVEYRRELVDVRGVVTQVVASAQGTITDRGATVRVGSLPPAWGDRTAIEQLFANLVGNALTYLDPTRPGLIEVGTADAPTGSLTFFVRDNGLGIAEAHRAKIFQPFQRAHPGVGSGEGLGLAIVGRVVERHRGRVWVESTPGVGSTFFVTLPVPSEEGGSHG